MKTWKGARSMPESSPVTSVVPTRWAYDARTASARGCIDRHSGPTCCPAPSSRPCTLARTLVSLRSSSLSGMKLHQDILIPELTIGTEGDSRFGFLVAHRQFRCGSSSPCSWNFDGHLSLNTSSRAFQSLKFGFRDPQAPPAAGPGPTTQSLGLFFSPPLGAPGGCWLMLIPRGIPPRRLIELALTLRSPALDVGSLAPCVRARVARFPVGRRPMAPFSHDLGARGQRVGGPFWVTEGPFRLREGQNRWFPSPQHVC